jgi:hypothetical protein
MIDEELNTKLHLTCLMLDGRFLLRLVCSVFVAADQWSVAVLIRCSSFISMRSLLYSYIGVAVVARVS